MLSFIPQCKGKDLTDLAASAIPNYNRLVYNSIKWDGNYIQIVVDRANKEVKFFTSGGKEFYVLEYALDFIKLAEYFTGCNIVRFEAEWVGNTTGLLGTREKSQGIITTWRVEHTKGIKSKAVKNGKFKVFDFMGLDEFCLRENRLSFINKDRLNTMQTEDCIDIVDYSLVLYSEARKINQELRNKGYEGGYIKLDSHTHKQGKRVNTAIKDKPRPTYDLLCVGVTDGDGKYQGMIGALVLKDSMCRTVDVGSGLTDIDRNRDKDYFIGKVIEIEAERRNTTTYIQPVYKFIRQDKTKEDIS